DYLTKPFNHAELIARLNTGKRILKLERSLRKANEEIRILSITDPLTKCYNRRYMNEHLPKEINRARRYGHPLSVILCDIDHFKEINDTYGHQAGDMVLKRFARCLKESIRRDVDWVIRYGGEEFLIVLPETGLMSSLSIAERLRIIVSQTEIMWDKENIRITASFGTTGFDNSTPDEKISVDAMINMADRYLYQAKEEGRNRVVSGELL
nr:diguanylate cyclase [Desulfobacterales bacterium]